MRKDISMARLVTNKKTPEELIEALYHYDEESAMNQVSEAAFTLKIPVDDWAMFKAIGARFDISLQSFVSNLLIGQAQEAFDSLSKKDQEDLSVTADTLVHDHYAKKGCGSSCLLAPFSEKFPDLKPRNEDGYVWGNFPWSVRLNYISAIEKEEGEA